MITSPDTAARRDLWVSALLLCLVSPFMAEVLSGNQTPWSFVLLSVALVPIYGFPILLLREWAVRRRISLAGLLLTGFGYGLYNEGLMAKTLFLNKKVPWDLFDGHIGWGGVNWGWSLVICSFHALFSVVTPLLLLEKLRPRTAGQTWLSKRSALFLLIVIVVFSLAYFRQTPLTAPIGFYLLWAAIALGVLIASLLPGNWVPSPKKFNAWGLVWLGAFILPMLLMLSVGFANGLPAPGFALLWLCTASFYMWLALKGGPDGTLAMGLGAYAGMSAANIIVGNPVAKVVGFLAFVAIISWLRRNKHFFSPQSTV